MSNLNLSNDIFLGTNEVNMLSLFMREYPQTTLQQNSLSYGLVRNKTIDPNFINGKVTAGSGGSIKVGSVFAIDKKGRRILKDADDLLDQITGCVCDLDSVLIPDDGSWRWVIIQHSLTSVEDGVVALDGTSNKVIGVDTKFTKLFRSGEDANYIKIIDSSLNPSELRIASVDSDTELTIYENILSEGDINDKKTLKYFEVHGTFSYSAIKTEQEKKIYQYDSYNLKIIANNGNSLPTPSSLPNGETEVYGENTFVLAKVKNNGGNIVIIDKRDDIFREKGDFLYSETPEIKSICSVESVKFAPEVTTQDYNIVTVGWGISGGFSHDFNNNTITLNDPVGGSISNIDSITNGDFDGWVVKFLNGITRRVISSTVTSGALQLKLEVLNDTDFQGSNEKVLVVPDYEKANITISALEYENNQNFTYDIFEGKCSIIVPVIKEEGENQVNGYVSYSNNKNTTRVVDFSDGSFYGESQFNNQGVLKGGAIRNKSVNGGIFNITSSPNGYNAFKSDAITGDRYGYSEFILNNTSANRKKDLQVGQQTMIQRLIGSTSDGNSINQNEDYVINLKTEGAKNGNTFEIILHPKDGIIPRYSPIDKFIIVQDFDETKTSQTILKDLSVVASTDTHPVDDFFYRKMNQNALSIRYVFNGASGNWIEQSVNIPAKSQKAYARNGVVKKRTCRNRNGQFLSNRGFFYTLDNTLDFWGNYISDTERGLVNLSVGGGDNETAEHRIFFDYNTSSNPKEHEIEYSKMPPVSLVNFVCNGSFASSSDKGVRIQMELYIVTGDGTSERLVCLKNFVGRPSEFTMSVEYAGIRKSNEFFMLKVFNKDSPSGQANVERISFSITAIPLID